MKEHVSVPDDLLWVFWRSRCKPVSAPGVGLSCGNMEPERQWFVKKVGLFLRTACCGVKLKEFM